MSDSGNRWAFRALAVTIAVGIWLPASFCPRLREVTVPPIEESVEARVTIPDHPEMIVLGAPTDDVFVHVRGSEGAIASLDRDRIRVLVPLRENIFEGRFYGGPRDVEVILAAEDVVLPSDAEGIRVVSLTPDRLMLTVDEEISDLVPVEVDFVGEPIGGSRIDHDGVRIDPEIIQVRGSRSEITLKKMARAGPVDIGGRGLDFVAEQVRVRFDSEYVQVVAPTFVRIAVPMITEQQPQSSGAGP